MSSDHFNATDGAGCFLELGTSNVELDDPLLGNLVVDPASWSAFHQPDAASPLRDAGNPLNVGITACLGTDQLNAERPTDGDGDGNARCDIGAIEAAFVPLGDNLFGDGFE
ncbi:MAG: hypothetical protein IPK97_12500 [Ahniella sp.]|nr:hypothetical protein [Ahniella sp.]